MSILSPKTWAIITTFFTLAHAIPTHQTSVSCDRESLIKATDSYVAAQTAGNLTPLQSILASNWTYVENNKLISFRSGVLSKPLSISHRKTNADTTTCRTYSELIVTDPKNPYVIGTQIQFNANMKVTSIDTIASTTNSWLFDAKKTLQYILTETWSSIPLSARDSRQTIQAAGDAYLDMWSSSTSSLSVPWGTPCVRLEGSSYTGKGAADDSCKPGIPSNHSQAPNSKRRYVVDVEMGSVSILCVWEHMMDAADSHEFRLEGGR
jgi:hypothetical protein